MLTKQKIASTVIRFIEGGQIPNFRKVSNRDVYERIEIVRNMMMDANIKEFGDLGGEYVTQYGVNPKIEVICDPITLQKYSILPARLISFGDYSGLRQISPLKNQGQSFVFLDNGFLQTFKGLEAGQLHGHTGYYIERVKIGTDQSLRVYYVNIPTDYDNVLIKMIASTYDFDEDEQLPIPAQHELNLLTQVGQFFNAAFQVPEDIREGLTPKIQAA